MTGRGAGSRSVVRRVLRYLAVPVVLGGVLLAFYGYVTNRGLDRIERRTLNADFLLARTGEHLVLVGVVTVLVLVIAIPLGTLLTRRPVRRAVPAVLAVANVAQAVPSIGVLVLLFLLFINLGAGPIAVIAFVAYAILPVLRNTMVGLERVDPSIIESARGVGMTRLAVLARIELPLAVPVILAGARTALVISVGTVALATFIDAGGLGDVIESGITSYRNLTLVTGAVLVAALALLVDWLAGIAEDLLCPRGL